MSNRADQLAQRVAEGAQHLIDFASGLTDEQWHTRCGGENRTVGTLVHHVGTMYPIEADVVNTLAANGSAPGVTWDVVDSINSDHASTNGAASKQAAIDLIRTNSVVAVDAVRALTDEQLDRTAPNDLHWLAPMTVQFFVEQHPIAHPYIHLQSIKAALGAR